MSASYSNVYAVTLSNGTYEVSSLTSNSATVTDNVSNGVTDQSWVLGDVTDDQFTITGSGLPTNGNWTYLELASDTHGPNNSSGFIAQGPDGQYYFFTDTALKNVSGNNANLTVEAGQETICFMPGTAIRTPDGKVAVEVLKRGDLVLTVDGDSIPISWIGRQTVCMTFADPLQALPIRIRAGALDDNTPTRDLLLSPSHAVLVDGVLVQAAALVNGSSIVRETTVPRTFTYYHVEVDSHALILAEDVPAETFIDNVDRLAFDNWDEHKSLFPEGKDIVEMPYPRAKSHRQLPGAIRARLAARTSALDRAKFSWAA